MDGGGEVLEIGIVLEGVALGEQSVELRGIGLAVKQRFGRQGGAPKAPAVTVVDEDLDDLLERAGPVAIGRDAEERVEKAGVDVELVTRFEVEGIRRAQDGAEDDRAADRPGDVNT